jgi:hypothetical protein
MLKHIRLKLIILAASVIITAIFIVSYFIFFQYKEDNVKAVINTYLTDRYNDISFENFDESIAKQTKYYSNKLNSSPSWVNSEADLKAGKKYFQDTGYITKILTSTVEKLDRKKYSADIYVLYINGHSEDDNFVKYRYVFTVNKKGLTNYVFDNIELTSNVITYIKGGELHLHDGEVVICDVNQHADGEEYTNLDEHTGNIEPSGEAEPRIDEEITKADESTEGVGVIENGVDTEDKLVEGHEH